MKKLLQTNQFFLGLLSGILVVSLLSFAPGFSSEEGGQNINSVTVNQAQTMHTNYMLNAMPMNEILKGVTIDANQVSAMAYIKASNPGVSTFRLYFGEDNSGNDMGIVVGVNAAGQDMVGGTIYATSAGSMNSCPVICDNQSQISAE